VDATDIQLEGISLRFTAEFSQRTSCKLDAVPARGYEGTCALASGDTVAMTLVPPIAGMLLPDHEVLLARDAGPPDIARNASVFVLGPSGYSEVVRGTNGFTGFVERPTADDVWPMCQNHEAAEALMPVEQARMRLHVSKVNETAITDSVLAGYRRKQFRAPPSGAMAYMLSRYAWTTTNRETGARGFISPHLHFYAPYTTNQRVGIDTAQRPVVPLPLRVEREGRPDASIIVGVKLIPAAPHP
jgi:hypothetical protein